MMPAAPATSGQAERHQLGGEVGSAHRDDDVLLSPHHVGHQRALAFAGSSIRASRALAQADRCPYTVAVRFEWDPRKAAANLRSHGVSFAEAVTVLDDDHALTRQDPDTHEEHRFVTLGLSDSRSCSSSCTRIEDRTSSG